jgi:hypothetical protein
MVLADIPQISLVPNSGIMDLIFHQSWVRVSIFNIPPDGYRLTFIGLIIIVLLALLVNALTERLTSKKMGGLFTAVLVTIFGSVFTAAYVKLPFDFAIEGVRIIAALLGALIIAVFLVLLRGAFGGGKG